MSLDGPFIILAGMAVVAASVGLLAVARDGRRALGRAIVVAAVTLVMVVAAVLHLNHLAATHPGR